MTEDETVSEYNERVLEIANDSLLLCEKMSESKIIRKVLLSLPRKFDMKVTAIEEAQDITTLKLDELFGSLLTFEMAMSDRESKKGKGIAFKSVYDQKNTVNQSGNEANQDESIALLTKQFSKMARKFKSLNTAGKTEKTGRHDCENSIRKVNDFSYRRNSDHVTDKNNQVFMSGRWESDNCYHWSSNGSNISHLTKVDQTWLWHRKLGHISLRSLDKVIRNEGVIGIPSLDINGKFFCSDC
ncbi:gag-pol polyprotein [Cucumis melo var. makuwa]|uniref:Gag-pol polyprotein n=1 Tax=Cucumis melo var. makuwa TaxID=1194695 RepID=A0A5D3BB00_CUCMM|nr:gag-pol polyprotein [Cucumis melo var. makuwa]TYJ95791.1 gag-pol polyprotein [Cucumis melo var. makuwa]